MKNKKPLKIIFKIIKTLFILGFISFLIIAGLIALWSTTLNLPDLKNFNERKISQSTKIYDRSGQIVLFDIHGNIKRTVVPISEISELVQKATIAIEDKHFYEHNGIQVSSIFRAIYINIKEGDLLGGQGGSTITQQVIKNALLTTDKKVSRKIKEWILAPKLEKVLTKEQILEIYLNEVPYGGNVYGVQEASRKFFSKDAKDLNLAESAYLAALPQAPTFYSPYGNNLDRLENRKNYVLDQMVLVGYITKEQADEAKNTKITFQKQEEFGIKAPHFVVYVRELLEEKYGKELVEEGGLKVTTTLDWEMQQKAEEIVLRKALDNEKNVDAENAALLSINPKNGEVLVMVGSRDYFDEKIDGNFNITTSKRQPGSVFKPIVYAEAFNKGYRPETIVFDLETEFSVGCKDDPNNCYSPVNYDGLFRGPMSLRDALAQSINIPAVKVLYLSGLRDSLNLAKKMGIETLTNVNQYGLTLVLGGGEVKPIEVAKAYSIFANDGVRNEINTILKIENNKGEVLYDIENERNKTERVLSEQTSRLINDVLSDNKARTPAFGTNSPLYFEGRDVAAKTGTTNDYRDAWIVGYTPNFLTIAWAGNNNNSPMQKKVASYIVSPMWNEFMKFALEKVENVNFFKPEPMDPNTKSIIAGYWKGEQLSVIENEDGSKKTVVTGKTDGIHSILYYIDKNNPLGPKPENPQSDQQYELWEEAVQKWVRRQDIKDDFEIIDLEKLEKEQLNIISIENNGTYNKDTEFVVIAQIKDNREIKSGEIFINDKKVGDLSIPDNSFYFIPQEKDYVLYDQKNILKVVVEDKENNKLTKEIDFYIK